MPFYQPVRHRPQDNRKRNSTGIWMAKGSITQPTGAPNPADHTSRGLSCCFSRKGSRTKQFPEIMAQIWTQAY